MKQYLKMADVFPVEIRTDDESGSLICDEDGVILESFSGDKVADYTLHAINSHDELVAQRNELLSALEQCRDAFEYTRQYVGYETLPPINGWSWFDADQRAKDAIAKAKGESQ